MQPGGPICLARRGGPHIVPNHPPLLLLLFVLLLMYAATYNTYKHIYNTCVYIILLWCTCVCVCVCVGTHHQHWDVAAPWSSRTLCNHSRPSVAYIYSSRFHASCLQTKLVYRRCLLTKKKTRKKKRRYIGNITWYIRGTWYLYNI